MDIYKIKPDKLFIAALAVWIILWANFLMRDLFRGGSLRDYKRLMRKNSEERRRYTYGERFYDFLNFAKDKIPPGSTYKFAGPGTLLQGERSLMYRRGVYYLYPLIEEAAPDYYLLFYREDPARTGILETKTGHFRAVR
jgi:hypothetical protein